MILKNEDGLDFWCIPIKKYRFNFNESDTINVITINLDGDLHVVGAWDDPKICKHKARNFVGKYKIPVKVISVTQTEDDLKFADQYNYTSEFYEKWKNRKES